MSLLQRFQQHWKDTFPQIQPANSRLLLAVSGGVDSVVLTHLVAAAGFDCVIAHCNFQLRGEESERDEQFVRELAARYNKDILVKRFDTAASATAHKLSIQEAARKLRYEWFAEQIHSTKQPVTSNQQPATGAPPTSYTVHRTSYIVTAHHADDNIETVLMQFFRGTGIQGLRGIQPLQPEQALLRPLLPFRKQELLAFASEQGLGFVEDSSNASDKYTRNFFRHQLIPAIKEVFPQVEANLLQNIERMKETEILYRQSVNLHKQKLMERKGNEWHIPVLKLKQTPALQTIVWEIIKDYGFTAAQVNEVIRLLEAANGSYIASATHRIIRNRQWIILTTLQTTEAQHILIDAGIKEIVFAEGQLVIEHKTITNNQPFPVSSSPLIAVLDAATVSFPLLLRKWKQGDYFYPLGMQKKKKLSRFFIDNKLSQTEKEKIWVIESNKKIIWIPGLRIDDRCKLTPATSKALLLTYNR